jgi:hypothetical protein
VTEEDLVEYLQGVLDDNLDWKTTLDGTDYQLSMEAANVLGEFIVRATTMDRQKRTWPAGQWRVRLTATKE